MSLEEFENVLCSPGNCKFYFQNCILGCPHFTCDNCKRKNICDLKMKLNKMLYIERGKPYQSNLVDFTPEAFKKEIAKIRENMSKCLNKRVWLTKNKGFNLFEY